MFWRLLNRQPSRLAPLKLCPKSRNANADFNFFRAVPRTQFFHFSRSSFVPSPVVAVSAATPPLVQQKKAPCKHRFFCFTWGVIVEPLTNALRLFAHFFRRLPKGIYLKKQHYRIGNLPKKSSARLKLISRIGF